MKRIAKRSMAFLLAALTGISMLFPWTAAAKVKADTSEESALPFRELTGEELTEEMGVGWNLGNTMDGHTGFTPNETTWQHVKTTKALIKSVHDLGFNTIRVPVTWGTMINDENGYSINETWLSRVQDIVDYAIAQDMYVIINIHHDGAEQSGWLRIATDDKDALYEKFGGVWKNIAERFKDYDEHLIFEAMNEVQGRNMTLAQENAVIMDLNQIFVDTVRATGSNNAKRWLVVCGKYNLIWALVNEDGAFKMPQDSVENRIILSVHDYTPWNFCGDDNMNTTTYSVSELKSNNEAELAMLEQFTSAGIPVIVGEYGCLNKNNLKYRTLFIEGMNRLFRKYHLVGIYWDQGWYDRSMSPDYSFTIIDRATGEPVEKEVTDAILRGFYSGETDLDTLEMSPAVTEITNITIKEASVELTIGDTYELTVSALPENNNDVLIYRTDDKTVATVYNGRIRARGIGETTITVSSQSGSVQESITVRVNAAGTDTPCNGIGTDADKYSFHTGEYAYLNAQITTSGCDSYLTYRSSDESVATVSSIGKIVATGEGNATITVTSSDGFSKNIAVTVSDKQLATEITLALNVYYNDNSHSYFSNEVSSQTITLDSPGQYTLTFDCAADLSAAATNAGVNTLSNLTAIYIKDYDVTTGNTTSSPLESCDIFYDEIKVNGQALTITQQQPKSALKASGIFDTNDPMNSWDGSAVEEVKCSNNVLNFSTITKPVTIEVTFTLSNMQFIGQDKLPDAVVTVTEPTPPAGESDDNTEDGTQPSMPEGDANGSTEPDVTDGGSEGNADNEATPTAADDKTDNPANSDTEKADSPANSSQTSSDGRRTSDYLWIIFGVVAVAVIVSVTVVIVKKDRSDNR